VKHEPTARRQHLSPSLQRGDLRVVREEIVNLKARNNIKSAMARGQHCAKG
jgi:hypothetical protein